MVDAQQPQKQEEKSGSVVVRNNGVQIHRIPSSLQPAPGAAKNPSMLFAADQAGITLMPGNNVVPAKAWAGAQRIKLVQHYLEDGACEGDRCTFEEICDLPGDGKSLARLELKQALALIKGTFNRELLKAWKAGDTRGEVRSAVDEKIDSLEIKPREQPKKQSPKDLDLPPQ